MLYLNPLSTGNSTSHFIVRESVIVVEIFHVNYFKAFLGTFWGEKIFEIGWVLIEFVPHGSEEDFVGVF